MSEKTAHEKLVDDYPDIQGIGGELRERHPGFFDEVAAMANLITIEYGFAQETGEGDYDKLDAILEDVKVLIQIDPDNRR